MEEDRARMAEVRASGCWVLLGVARCCQLVGLLAVARCCKRMLPGSWRRSKCAWLLLGVAGGVGPGVYG